MKTITFPSFTGLKPRAMDSADTVALKLFRLERGKQFGKLVSFENELGANGWTLDEIDHARSHGKLLSQCEIK